MSFIHAGKYKMNAIEIKNVINDDKSNFRIVKIDDYDLNISPKNLDINLIEIEDYVYDNVVHKYQDEYNNFLTDDEICTPDLIKINVKYEKNNQYFEGLVEPGTYKIYYDSYILSHNSVVDSNNEDYSLNILNDGYEIIVYEMIITYSLVDIEDYIYNGTIIKSVNNEKAYLFVGD